MYYDQTDIDSMLIAGAGGHAIEVLHIFDQLGQLDNLCFFDNTLKDEATLFGRFKVICLEEALAEKFSTNPRFVLGLGNPKYRKLLADHLQNHGGELTSVISPMASIGSFDVTLAVGLNVMPQVMIYNRVRIGEGCLLNTGCSIHHDVIVGQYCEICPGARLLGGVSVGEYSFIGSGAIVLPGISIGHNCIVGAGAVVTKDVGPNSKIKGIPAR